MPKSKRRSAAPGLSLVDTPDEDDGVACSALEALVAHSGGDLFFRIMGELASSAADEPDWIMRPHGKLASAWYTGKDNRNPAKALIQTCRYVFIDPPGGRDQRHKQRKIMLGVHLQYSVLYPTNTCRTTMSVLDCIASTKMLPAESSRPSRRCKSTAKQPLSKQPNPNYQQMVKTAVETALGYINVTQIYDRWSSYLKRGRGRIYSRDADDAVTTECLSTMYLVLKLLFGGNVRYARDLGLDDSDRRRAGWGGEEGLETRFHFLHTNFPLIYRAITEFDVVAMLYFSARGAVYQQALRFFTADTMPRPSSVATVSRTSVSCSYRLAIDTISEPDYCWVKELSKVLGEDDMECFIDRCIQNDKATLFQLCSLAESARGDSLSAHYVLTAGKGGVFAFRNVSWDARPSLLPLAAEMRDFFRVDLHNILADMITRHATDALLSVLRTETSTYVKQNVIPTLIQDRQQLPINAKREYCPALADHLLRDDDTVRRAFAILGDSRQTARLMWALIEHRAKTVWDGDYIGLTSTHHRPWPHGGVSPKTKVLSIKGAGALVEDILVDYCRRRQGRYDLAATSQTDFAGPGRSWDPMAINVGRIGAAPITLVSQAGPWAKHMRSMMFFTVTLDGCMQSRDSPPGFRSLCNDIPTTMLVVRQSVLDAIREVGQAGVRQSDKPRDRYPPSVDVQIPPIQGGVTAGVGAAGAGTYLPMQWWDDPDIIDDLLTERTVTATWHDTARRVLPLMIVYRVPSELVCSVMGWYAKLKAQVGRSCQVCGSAVTMDRGRMKCSVCLHEHPPDGASLSATIQMELDAYKEGRPCRFALPLWTDAFREWADRLRRSGDCVFPCG